MKTTRKDNGHTALAGKMLAMDTATSSMTVALLQDGLVMKQIDTHAERNHSLYLIPQIQDALRELGWSPRDLEAITVGLGPGSYTGVRIGVTVAKTMAWALQLPVLGVSSLEAMAAGGWMEKQAGGISGEKAGPGDGDGFTVDAALFKGTVWLIPLVNARRGQAYSALYGLTRNGSVEASSDHSRLNPVGEPGWQCLYEDAVRLMDPWTQELLQVIREAEQRPDTVIFIGEEEGFSDLTDSFQRECEALGVAVDIRPYLVQAKYIGLLGYRALLLGETAETHTLLPNYTQLAEAEVKLLAKKK